MYSVANVLVGVGGIFIKEKGFSIRITFLLKTIEVGVMDYGFEIDGIIGMDFIKLITTIMGVAFPSFLIKAIKAQNDEVTSKYTIWACVSFGIVVLTFNIKNKHS